jgi:small subunit ribosomal protein S20
MANTPQAKKRIRRNDRRAEVNGNRIGRIRTFVKKVEMALASGDKSVAAQALAAAQPELARGVAKGVMHKNTVARKISRLTPIPVFRMIEARRHQVGGPLFCFNLITE